MVIASCNQKFEMEQNSENEVLYLKNDHLSVGILPGIGGRIVHASLKGHANLLKSDPELWNTSKRPEISAKSSFVPFNGHIVWLGPQSEWWTKQDLNPEKKKEKSVWPPDPYLIYGNYDAVMHMEDSLVMEGPDSPVSGVSLSKEVKLIDHNTIKFSVTAQNISGSEKAWDLWLNTRVDGYGRCYVPSAKDDIRIKANVTDEKGDIPYVVEDGYFRYINQNLSGNKESYASKAFIHSQKPYIAYFDHNQLLIIEFEMHAREEIHPEQALVEIFNHIEPDDSTQALMELEYHSPYQRIAPEQSISTWQLWHIFPYDGEDNIDQQTEFLNSKLQTI